MGYLPGTRPKPQTSQRKAGIRRDEWPGAARCRWLVHKAWLRSRGGYGTISNLLYIVSRRANPWMAKTGQMIECSNVSGPAQLIIHQRSIKLVAPNPALRIEVTHDIFANQHSRRIRTPLFVIGSLEKDQHRPAHKTEVRGNHLAVNSQLINCAFAALAEVLKNRAIKPSLC